MTIDYDNIKINWKLFDYEGSDITNNIITQEFIKQLKSSIEKIENEDKNPVIMALEFHNSMMDILERHSGMGAADTEGRSMLLVKTCEHFNVPQNIFN